MNEVFIVGKLVEKIKYNFIIDNKEYFSKAEFEVEINKQKFKIMGYNNIADFCYRKLEKNDVILINGMIKTNMKIIIKSIIKL